MASPKYGTHPYGHGRTPPPPSPLSETLVDATRSSERPSIELKISGSGANILNAVVVDPAGRPLYSISSDESRTKLLSLRDDTQIATVNWDRASPRMVFRGKKVKCKEWLPRAGSDTESRTFAHGNSQYTWIQQSDCGFLIPANRPGLAVAKWRTESRANGLYLQIFQEVLAESGLLEAILLSIALLQSGRSFGDTLHPLASRGPQYFSISAVTLSHYIA